MLDNFPMLSLNSDILHHIRINIKKCDIYIYIASFFPVNPRQSPFFSSLSHVPNVDVNPCPKKKTIEIEFFRFHPHFPMIFQGILPLCFSNITNRCRQGHPWPRLRWTAARPGRNRPWRRSPGDPRRSGAERKRLGCRDGEDGDG